MSRTIFCPIYLIFKKVMFKFVQIIKMQSLIYKWQLFCDKYSRWNWGGRDPKSKYLLILNIFVFLQTFLPPNILCSLEYLPFFYMRTIALELLQLHWLGSVYPTPNQTGRPLEQDMLSLSIHDPLFFLIK